jgi:hypothetical protein
MTDEYAAQLEARVAFLEARLDEVLELLIAPKEEEKVNKDGLPFGIFLRGESKGSEYWLEVIPEGYCCSDGVIYNTLSAAAKGVSGNQRSGWVFWQGRDNTPIGELIGRFKENAQRKTVQIDTKDYDPQELTYNGSESGS